VPLPLIPVLVAGGGIAYVAATSGSPPSAAPTKIAAGGGINITAGAASPGGTIVSQVAALGVAPIATRTYSGRPQFASGLIAAIPSYYVAPQSNPIDAELQKKLDYINQYGQAAYENMDAAAKQKGAAILNDQLKLDPPLKGDESWETVAKIAGGAAGTAALGWLPGGAIVGPMVGAYLGVKIEELLSKNVDEIKTWFSSRWSSIESWVKGVGGDVADVAEDAYDFVAGWF
jgi:hypothetical protein